MQYICISNARMQGLRLCLFFLLFEMDTLSAGVRVERGESRGSEREEGKERKGDEMRWSDGEGNA